MSYPKTSEESESKQKEDLTVGLLCAVCVLLAVRFLLSFFDSELRLCHFTGIVTSTEFFFV